MERKLHSIIADAVAHCLARADGVDAREVLDHLTTTCASELQEHAEAMLRMALLRLIKHQLKETAYDDGVLTHEPAQQSLPGYAPPTTLAVYQEETGEYRYVRFGKLRSHEFLRALATRQVSILHDQKRLQNLQDKWEVLKPYLLADEEMQVEEAIALFQRDHAPATIHH